MSNIRQERVSAEISKALGEIIKNLNDPRIKGIITVLEVTVTKDFSYADILLSVYDTTDKESVIEGIRHSSGFIRRELAKIIGSIHTMPQLKFTLDNSEHKINRINELLQQINKEK